MLDRARLDAIYQYSLAIAAMSEDFRQRQLGAIHLLKYAYLADLAHAARREGQTYSGAPWRFYHFGPWATEAFERIEPAIEAAAARTFRIQSFYADDFTRFALDRDAAEEIARRQEQELPLIVYNAISRAVAEHGSDTADLLRHVYLTEPMLAARPGELLDFTTAIRRPRPEAIESSQLEQASSKERKRRAETVEAARVEIKKRLATANRKRVVPTPAPRYDSVFFEGTAELDRLAGEPMKSSTGRIAFDDSIWDSSQRRDPEIS